MVDQVQVSYESLLADTNEMRSKDAREVHFAMVEIYLSAGKLDSALQLLARLNKLHGQEGPIGVMLLLAFAKARKWEAFQTTLELLGSDKSFIVWKSRPTTAFNHALHLYARAHNAAETSHIAMRAIDYLGFIPNISTFNVLISSFVEQKDLALIEKWLQIRRSFSLQPKFDSNPDLSLSRLAASLLKRWYLEFRHSHVMVMWYCRALLQKAQCLQGELFGDIIKESIAYDIRTLSGRNALWMEPLIRAREQLMQQLAPAVPNPGYIRDRQLHGLRKISRSGRPEPMPRATQIAGQATSSPSTNQIELSSLERPREPSQDADHNQLGRALHETPATDAQPVTAVITAPSIVTEAVADHDLPPAPGFLKLRAIYSDEAHDRLDRLNRELVLALSLSQYQKVLDLYESSRDPAGRPPSPFALEIAVEASIRQQGHCEHAKALLAAASDAGFNAGLCTGPLIIDQIRTMTVAFTKGTRSLSRAKANKIIDTTLDYYHQNDLLSYTTKPHLATHAAHTLIACGQSLLGLNLLARIFKPEQSELRQLDISVMSVWLLGYAAKKQEKGMQWVADTVLERHMRIDAAFIRALKCAKRPAFRGKNGVVTYGIQTPATTAKLQHWQFLCSERRAKQMHESKVFGRKLIDLLARAANEEYEAEHVKVELGARRGVSLVRAVRSAVSEPRGEAQGVQMSDGGDRPKHVHRGVRPLARAAVPSVVTFRERAQ